MFKTTLPCIHCGSSSGVHYSGCKHYAKSEDMDNSGGGGFIPCAYCGSTGRHRSGCASNYNDGMDEDSKREIEERT